MYNYKILLLFGDQVNPQLTPVQSSDTNAMIAGGLVCGTVLVAVVIIVAVCYVRRRDKGKQLRYLEKGANSAPRMTEVADLANGQKVLQKTKRTTMFTSILKQS